MILSNLYKIWGGLFINSSVVKVRDMNGTERAANRYSPKANFNYFSSGYEGYVSIWFGYGDAAVAFDDYSMNHPYNTSNIVDNNYLTPSESYEPSTGVCELTRTFILTNNRNTPLDVKEIGISVGGQSSNTQVLIYREVLPANKQFVVAAGETIKYTHTFRFTVPTSSDE